MLVSRSWFPDLGFQSVVSRGALGNKSGSFCEAVNCERSEQEGKFLFAMLVSSYWFPVTGFQLLVSCVGFQRSIGEQKRKLL